MNHVLRAVIKVIGQTVRKYIHRIKSLPNSIRARKLNQLVPDGYKINNSFAKVPQRSRRLSTMASESYNRLQRYLTGDRSSVSELLEGRRYVLISGSPRTGGSYVTDHLRLTLAPETEGDPIIGDESIPEFRHLKHAGRCEVQRRQALYELIQWAWWIDKQYPDTEIVVKKCSGFCYAFDIVEEFFGGSDLTIVLTTRHPAAIYRSVQEAVESKQSPFNPVAPISNNPWLFREQPPDWWRTAPRWLRCLYFWHDLYKTACKSLSPHLLQRTRLVKYGEQPSAIRRVVRELNDDGNSGVIERLRMDPFQSSDRSYGSQWDTVICKGVVRDACEEWAAVGKEFPVAETPG